MQTEIKTKNLILRRYEKRFAPLLFEAAIESHGRDFSRWMPWCHENYTIDDSRNFIEKVEKNWQDETQFGFAIFDSQENEFLGGIGLNQKSETHKFYNLGYWVRVSKQNRGVISEATRSLAQAAFADLQINRVEILMAIENIPSQKAAEKAGAKREGVLRKRLIIGDRAHDALMFSFVREDFQK